MKSTLKLTLVGALLAATGVAYSMSPMGGGQCEPMMGPFGGMDPGSVFSVLEWLGRHGVSIDQLVPRG